MSYVGLVPSECSTGLTPRGSITKAGNNMVRQTLIESAWSYRFPPAMSPRWRKRNTDVSKEIRAISWEAQKRLNYKYRKLGARKMMSQKVITGLVESLLVLYGVLQMHRERKQKPLESEDAASVGRGILESTIR